MGLRGRCLGSHHVRDGNFDRGRRRAMDRARFNEPLPPSSQAKDQADKGILGCRGRSPAGREKEEVNGN